MLPPQACVAVEIAGPSAAQEQRAALERRCSEILGARRCRIVVPGQEDTGPKCWRAQVTSEGEGTPTDASVVLRDDTDPLHVPVRRDITFRPNDALTERWATLGLVIAALVTVEEHSAAEAAPPAAPLVTGNEAPAIAVRAPAPEPREPLDGELRASAVGALGLLPAAALGARLEASLARGHFGALARATIFPGETRAALGARAAGDVQLASGGVGLCGLGTHEAWTLRVCAAGDLVRMRARGLGVAETSTAIGWTPAAGLGASVALRLASHLALTAEAEAVALLRRPTFAIDGVPEAFTPAPVGGTLAIGLAVPF